MPENDLIQKLKNFYFFFEDRYYNFLDKVNERVPIYNVIDRIDKVFPSFILFILLIILLIFGLFFLFTPLVFPQQFESAIVVVDLFNNPVSGASISLGFLNQSFGGKTNDSGEFSFTLPLSEVEAKVSVRKEGFQDFHGTILLTANEKNIITLSRETAEFGKGKEEELTIIVLDYETQSVINDRPVSAEFSCSTHEAVAPQNQATSSGQFKVQKPADCGTLFGTFSANGYQTKSSAPIINKTTYVKLFPLDATGKISVFVMDSSGNGVSSVDLTLTDSFGSVTDQTETTDSGTASFSKVRAGTYTISALHKDGRYAFKEGIEVLVGETTYVEMTLEDLNTGDPDANELMQLYLKIIDAEIEAPVENAVVDIYSNNVLFDSVVTGDSGLVQKNVSSDLNFFIVVWHEDYLTKFVKNVMPKDIGEKPEIIALTPLTEQNNGKIEVHVQKFVSFEEQEPVSGAFVYLYLESNPEVVLDEGITNDDGNVLFEGLPAENFFVKAVKNEEEGTSDVVKVVPGKTVPIVLNLVMGKGNIEVTVYDEETNLPLEDATVKFVDASNYEILQEGKTNWDGVFESKDFRADKSVIVRVSKEFYFEQETNPIQILSNYTQRIEVELTPVGFVPDVNVHIEFEGIFKYGNEDREESVLKSGMPYYLKFKIFLPQNADYKDLMLHVRVGDDSQIRLPLPNGYLIKIKPDNAEASHGGEIKLSACYNPENVFSTPSSDDCRPKPDGKMANTTWLTPQNETVYSLKLMVFTEAGLEKGTKIEIHYQGRAVVDGNEFETEPFTRIYTIGESTSQKGFSWQFFVLDPEAPKDEGLFEIESFSSEETPGSEFEPFPLQMNKDYGLYYLVHNGDRDYSSTKLQFENIPSNVFSFPDFFEEPPYVLFENESFEKDMDKENVYSEPISMRTEKQADETKIVFTLTSGTQNQTLDERVIYFEVLPSQNMKFDGLPDHLIAGESNQKISGVLKDAETNEPIEGAQMKISFEEFENIPFGETNEGGEFSYTIEQPIYSPVKLLAEKSGYADLQVIIPVQYAGAFNPQYDCVEVEPAPPDGLHLKPKEKGVFYVKTNACTENVSIKLESKLILDKHEFDLDADADSESIQVTADNPEGSEEVYLGQYPVFVRAKFESDVSYFNAAQLLVFITDPEGSCFSINKTSFDLSTEEEASGTISNACFVSSLKNLWMPELEIDTSKVLLNYGPDIPSLYEFDWRIEASGTEKFLDREEHVEQVEEWVLRSINTSQEEEVVTVEFNDIEVKRGNNLLFEAFAYKPCNYAYGSSFAQIREKDGKITITKNSGDEIEIEVDCSNNAPWSCEWTGSDCFESEADAGDTKCLNNIYPCWRNYLEIGLPEDMKVKSVMANVYNKNNEHQLRYSLYGAFDKVVYDYTQKEEQRTLTIGPNHAVIMPRKDLVFELGTVDVDLREADGYQGGVFENVSITPVTDSDDVELWIQGDKVLARYVGNDNPQRETYFTLRDISLVTSQYSLISVSDYVNEARER